MDCKEEREQTDFTWERKPHPMCIPHIVDGILAHLSVEELKKCRLVSSQYNEMACKALQSEETITFKNVSLLETYLVNIKPISERKFLSSAKRRYCSTSSLCSSELSSEYSSDGDEQDGGSGVEDDFDWSLNMEDGDDLRETIWAWKASSGLYRYSHRSFHFDYCDPAGLLEPFDYFFEHFGPQIRRLRYTTDLLPYNSMKTLGHMGAVWQDRLLNLEELVLEMKWGVPAHLFETPEGEEDGGERYPQVSLPKLTRLHLDVLLTDRDADRAELFFRQLLSVTPNIEEISIPGSKRFFDDYINVVLARVIMQSEVPRLSILNFCLALSDAQMRLLGNKRLPLHTLILDLEDLQFEAGGLQQEGNNLVDNNDEEAVFREIDDPQEHLPEPGEPLPEDNNLHPELPQQANQNGRRPSFTPISKQTLQRFLDSISGTLSSLHICFPQSPRHDLHTFTFLEDMTELKFLALGYFSGSARILDQLPALKKLELWNVQFSDCINLAIPTKYERVATVIS